MNDSELVVHGLRSMLERFAERVEVVVATTGSLDPHDHLLATVDIVLIDAFSRSQHGLDIAAELLADRPHFRTVLYTNAQADHLVRQALRLGVQGYILKSAPASELVAAIEGAARGQVVVSPELEHVLRRNGGTGSWAGANRGLSRREAEVLALLAEGRPPSQIAEKLDIALETVRSHLKRIYGKLGVNDRGGAVAIAWQEGLVDRESARALT